MWKLPLFSCFLVTSTGNGVLFSDPMGNTALHQLGYLLITFVIISIARANVEMTPVLNFNRKLWACLAFVMLFDRLDREPALTLYMLGAVFESSQPWVGTA
jgi:hypothetical protein